MILSAALCLFALRTPYRVLFLGNSHTAAHDLTGTVERLMESDGYGRDVVVGVRLGVFLNDLDTAETRVAIRSGKWNAVVLQGAMMSNSHKYHYSQDGGIELAQEAVKSGARAVLFAEWPRRGWDETEYILGIYGEIKARSGAEIMPVCRAWDAALAKDKTLGLWGSDGNHASELGSGLAAYTIFYFLSPGREPSWNPPAVPEDRRGLFRWAAKRAVATK